MSDCGGVVWLQVLLPCRAMIANGGLIAPSGGKGWCLHEARGGRPACWIILTVLLAMP